MISNEDLSASTAANKLLLVNLSTQTWNCYEIYELSCKLVDTEFFEDVRPIFELASRQCSELLCIALAMFNVSLCQVKESELIESNVLFAFSTAILEFYFKRNFGKIDLWLLTRATKFFNCATSNLDTEP